MVPQFSADLECAIRAATEASKAVMEIYETDFSFEMKTDHSPVTAADTASEHTIAKILAKTAYPIISEENDENPVDYSQGKAWIADPLDGTKDFIAKTGEFTILIGLIADGRPVGGVVYQPVTDTLWVAEQNQGAYVYRNQTWQRLHLQTEASLLTARVVMSRHHLSEKEKNIVQSIPAEYQQIGSCGFKITQIAEGKFDLYFAFGPNQWDTCAGNSILTEAGGRVTDVQGKSLLYGGLERKNPRGILAASSQVWAEFIEFYETYEKK